MALYPFTTVGLTSLTAAGTTQSIEVQASEITFQVTVTDINTNVVVRYEGSLDGTNFFNLDSADTTITANGTYGFALNGMPVTHVRLRLVSLSGSGNSTSVATVIGAL